MRGMKTPEQILRERERLRKWKREHPERTREINAASLLRRPRQYTPEQRAAAVKRAQRWAEKNPDRVAEHSRATARRYAAKHPEKIKQRFRDYTLRTKYNITWAQYRELLEAQGRECAICKTKTPGGRGCFPVDHDHATGKIRGLLCNSCNISIGAMGENPARLRAAADYIETHNLTPDALLA
jgi:hypothetical protein